MAYNVCLHDGTSVQIRALSAADRESMKFLIESLSDQSRYFRFASPTPRLSRKQLDALADLDGDRQFAWGAFHGDELIGMSRWVRPSPGSEVADLAVTVREDFHARGLGSLLLEALGLAASRSNIARLSFYVLGENRKAIRLLSRFGGKLQYSAGLGEGELPPAAFVRGRLEPIQVAA